MLHRLLTLILAGGTYLAGSAVASAAPTGASLGVRVAAVPEALYAHLPDLPDGRGAMVAEIMGDAPSDLRRHDILLGYNDTPIASPEHLTQLLAADTPDSTVRLRLLRGGKVASVTVRLGQASAAGPAAAGTAKDNGPSRVSVAVTPLPDGRNAVTIEYYQDGKLHRADGTGTPADIDQEMNRLPPRVQDLARTALRRIGMLEPRTESPQRGSR